MSGGGSYGYPSTAERLELFIRRYAVTNDKVARHLGWSKDQLDAYLSPKTRRTKASIDVCFCDLVFVYVTNWEFLTIQTTAVSCNFLLNDSQIADTAVDKLLMRYRVALAHQTLKSVTTKSLMPLEGSGRRSMAPSQVGLTWRGLDSEQWGKRR